MVAAKIATLAQGRPGKAANLPVLPTQPEAAALLNVSERTVRHAREVQERAAPELVEKVERGEIAVSIRKFADPRGIKRQICALIRLSIATVGYVPGAATRPLCPISRPLARKSPPPLVA